MKTQADGDLADGLLGIDQPFSGIGQTPLQHILVQAHTRKLQYHSVQVVWIIPHKLTQLMIGDVAGEIGIDIEIEENGTTFEENALIKARTISKKQIHPRRKCVGGV